MSFTKKEVKRILYNVICSRLDLLLFDSYDLHVTDKDLFNQEIEKLKSILKGILKQ